MRCSCSWGSLTSTGGLFRVLLTLRTRYLTKWSVITLSMARSSYCSSVPFRSGVICWKEQSISLRSLTVIRTWFTLPPHRTSTVDKRLCLCTSPVLIFLWSIELVAVQVNLMPSRDERTIRRGRMIIKIEFFFHPNSLLKFARLEVWCWKG